MFWKKKPEPQPFGIPLDALVFRAVSVWDSGGIQINQHNFSIDFSFLGVRYCARCLWNSHPFA